MTEIEGMVLDKLTRQEAIERCTVAKPRKGFTLINLLLSDEHISGKDRPDGLIQRFKHFLFEKLPRDYYPKWKMYSFSIPSNEVPDNLERGDRIKIDMRINEVE